MMQENAGQKQMLEESDYRLQFGAKLLRLRKAAGLTQAEVAKRCEVSHAAVQQWEKGMTSPSFIKRRMLSEVFGESFDDTDIMKDGLAEHGYSAFKRKISAAAGNGSLLERMTRERNDLIARVTGLKADLASAERELEVLNATVNQLQPS